MSEWEKADSLGYSGNEEEDTERGWRPVFRVPEGGDETVLEMSVREDTFAVGWTFDRMYSHVHFVEGWSDAIAFLGQLVPVLRGVAGLEEEAADTIYEHFGLEESAARFRGQALLVSAGYSREEIEDLADARQRYRAWWDAYRRAVEAIQQGMSEEAFVASRPKGHRATDHDWSRAWHEAATVATKRQETRAADA